MSKSYLRLWLNAHRSAERALSATPGPRRLTISCSCWPRKTNGKQQLQSRALFRGRESWRSLEGGEALRLCW